jgi:pimeloyl-ACP methyl ester carboxylesterase
MDRGHFWLGAEPETNGTDGGVSGAVHVEWARPEPATGRVVLIHGGGGQGTDWLQTPDGRPGWAPLLAAEGFETFVVDRPGHGRSPYDPQVLGPLAPTLPYEMLRTIFVPGPDAHERADLHTQWAGGEEALQQLAASGGPVLASFAEAHRLEQARLSALLQRVGRSTLITHSGGAPAGWLAAAACPDLVEAIVAVEPMGPRISSSVRSASSYLRASLRRQSTGAPSATFPSRSSRVRHRRSADSTTP